MAYWALEEYKGPRMAPFEAATNKVSRKYYMVIKNINYKK